jgi:hypothetical protein
LQSKVAFRNPRFPRRFPRLKNRFFASPVVRLSKIFARFHQQKPTFHPSLKNIFDFSFDSFSGSPIVTS